MKRINEDIIAFNSIGELNKYTLGKYGKQASMVATLDTALKTSNSKIDISTSIHSYTNEEGYMILAVRISPSGMSIVDCRGDANVPLYLDTIVSDIFKHSYRAIVAGTLNHSRIDDLKNINIIVKNGVLVVTTHTTNFKPFEIALIADTRPKRENALVRLLNLTTTHRTLTEVDANNLE